MCMMIIFCVYTLIQYGIVGRMKSFNWCRQDLWLADDEMGNYVFG